MKFLILIFLFIIYLFYLFNKYKKIENKVINDEDIHTDDVNDIQEIDSSKFNNLVYLDIKHLDNQARIIIKLEKDIVPRTCENFRELCKNKKYVQSIFHRVIKNFMIQGGDYTRFDGSGGKSIFGQDFNDENFILKHDRGTISMANSGPNTNGSQFFISTKKNKWLDGIHVVFGYIVDGMNFIENITELPTDKFDKPIGEVVIYDCGVL